MQKINTNELEEVTWSSPKGKFAGAGKEISEALGRKPQSTDVNDRHPFDVDAVLHGQPRPVPAAVGIQPRYPGAHDPMMTPKSRIIPRNGPAFLPPAPVPLQVR